MRKEESKQRGVLKRLGNTSCGVWPYMTAIILNACLHVVIALVTDNSVYSLARLAISFVFFIYPFYFVADVLWSLRPKVSAVLTGEIKINRKYYTNKRERNEYCYIG
ncbi:MAG: hypothetical protein FWG14_00775 [Peptococcaceae bacterium]|nr:hypothetical protein [Peptococcaceae bacterium]